MPELLTATSEDDAFWIELAFDWEAEPHPTLGFHLLQIGLANRPKTGPGTTASFASSLTAGDSLAFVLYDNTEDAEGSGTPFRLLQHVEVWFTPTRADQGHTGPFGLATGLATRPRATSSVQISSVTFGSSLAAWPLFRNDSDPQKPSPPTFELAHPGRFYLSARVAISDGEQTRIYRVDPEMIVNSTGAGGGGGGGGTPDA